jgi:hypothetical protein
MKYLKIILIIVFLTVMLSSISSGTGSMTSDDKTVYFEEEEPSSLNEWFYDLTLSEKIKLYNHWQKNDTHYTMYKIKTNYIP